MKDIENKDIKSLTKLLSDTRNVTKLRIKCLKWDILKAALDLKPELRFDNLKELDLSGNHITNEMIAEINDLLFSRIPSLTSFNRQVHEREEAGDITIANLTRLNLAGNLIGDVGARAIANSPNIAGLTSLNLSFNQIEDAVKEEIKARLNEINPKCVVFF